MKKLLSSANLDLEHKTGPALANVAIQSISSHHFLNHLYTKLTEKFTQPGSPDQLPSSMATKIQQELVATCASETIINSLQQGIDRGVSFKTHWIVGNKMMKKVIRETVEKAVESSLISDMDKNKAVALTKDMVLTAFQIGLVHTAPILYHKEKLVFIANTYQHLNMLPSTHSKLRLLRENHACECVTCGLSKVSSIISIIPDPCIIEKGLECQKSVGNRFRNSLLHFSLKKLQEMVDEKIICSMCEFFKMFFEKELVLYLHLNYNNDLVIIDSVFRACVRGQIKIQALTCPDYSGFVDNDGLWNFDFKALNGGEGVVARKSYALIAGLYECFKECGVTATITHDLPFFEFKDGFKSNECILSPDQVRDRLKKSLECIQSYYDINNIPAQTRSTEEIIQNEKFFQNAVSVYENIIPKFLEDEDFRKFCNETFNKRLGIYRAWFPQNEMGDEEYISFLKEKLYNQLAEYYSDTELYNDGESILIFADSPQMSYAYSFWKVPAICGHGKKSQQYVG